MSRYYRPLMSEQGHALAGGWARFDRVEVMQRGGVSEIVDVRDVPADILDILTAPRDAIAGLSMDAPIVMGILNVTPDSFSDGGDHAETDTAVARALQMQADGAVIVDIGGESTRPGAKEVPLDEEIARTAPVITTLSAQSDVAISIDTRKAAVARAAVSAGAGLVNDVTALRFDSDMAGVVAQSGVPVCLMHSIADPETMQDHAEYDDVLLDVYDHLAARVTQAEAHGIARAQIVVDPGIGFGKTLAHNLRLMRGLSLFHGLGCPILLGASRKRFIGTLGQAPEAKDRLGGSLSVAMEGVRQGVQILRVHDTFATKQALNLQMVMMMVSEHG